MQSIDDWVPTVSNSGGLGQPLLLKPEEAGRLIRAGRSTVYQMIASGELPSVLVGRSRRVPLAALRRWVEERTTANDAT